jgi:hypothetical protein
MRALLAGKLDSNWARAAYISRPQNVGGVAPYWRVLLADLTTTPPSISFGYYDKKLAPERLGRSVFGSKRFEILRNGNSQSNEMR